MRRDRILEFLGPAGLQTKHPTSENVLRGQIRSQTNTELINDMNVLWAQRQVLHTPRTIPVLTDRGRGELSTFEKANRHLLKKPISSSGNFGGRPLRAAQTKINQNSINFGQLIKKKSASPEGGGVGIPPKTSHPLPQGGGTHQNKEWCAPNPPPAWLSLFVPNAVLTQWYPCYHQFTEHLSSPPPLYPLTSEGTGRVSCNSGKPALGDIIEGLLGLRTGESTGEGEGEGTGESVGEERAGEGAGEALTQACGHVTKGQHR